MSAIDRNNCEKRPNRIIAYCRVLRSMPLGIAQNSVRVAQHSILVRLVSPRGHNIKTLTIKRAIITHMNHPPLSDFIWVDTSSTLENMLTDLQQQQKLAVDTESNSLYAFREQVCLIQFSTDNQDYLVDTLAGLDLSPLGLIFANSDIEKIFHAAEYDILCLKRDFHFEFINLFDTMQSARILGLKHLGLSSLLTSQFGIHLNKRYQKANWGKRPLPSEMRKYARMDTHYLIPLRQHLYSALHKAKRWKLALEDFQRLSQLKPSHNHKLLYTSVKGYNKLTPQQLAVLQKLCIFRERKARAANFPPFKILNNLILLKLAYSSPLTHEQLATVRELSPKLRQRYARGLLVAIRRGLESPPITNERHHPTDNYIARLELLKNWRKKTARRAGVQSDVIMPRDILNLIAKRNPQGTAELQLLMQNLPDRFLRFGKQILLILKEDET